MVLASLVVSPRESHCHQNQPWFSPFWPPLCANVTLSMFIVKEVKRAEPIPTWWPQSMTPRRKMRAPLPPAPGWENGRFPTPIPSLLPWASFAQTVSHAQGQDMLIGSRQPALTIELRVGAIPKSNARGQWFPQSKSGHFWTELSGKQVCWRQEKKKKVY